MQTLPGSWSPKGHQHISAPAASTALTVPAGARFCLITSTTQPIKLRDDGGTPTTGPSGNGVRIATGLAPFIYCGELSAVRIIQEAASAEVDILYYG
jgi:hypothetical protein